MDPSGRESSTQLLLPNLPSSSKRALVVRSFGRTDPGLTRTSNEDQFLIAELGRTMWLHQTSLAQPPTQYGGHRSHVVLVADGMGGQKAGEVASALTVTTMIGFILNILRRFSNLRATEEQGILTDFQTALQQAHARLMDESSQNPELSGMGTTFTMA